MKIEVSIGEIIDKITILEIKDERIDDEEKLIYIGQELKYLKNKIKREKVVIPEGLFNRLKKINEDLWDIEDLLRKKYDNKELDKEYMEKMIYDIILNDKRFLVKKEINNLVDSKIKEQKSYKGM